MNKVTLFVDPDIRNTFMGHACSDLMALVKDGQNGISKTSSQVRNAPLFINQIINLAFVKDWKKYEYIVFANLNVETKQTDAEYAVTMRNMFQ